MTKVLRLTALLMILSGATFAQTESKLAVSPVRSLKAEEYNAYLNGIDLTRRSYIAEINHYPLPDKLIQYKKELDLSPSQVNAVTAVVKFLKMKKTEIGQSIIRNEKMLDSIFRTGRMDEGTVIFYGNRYGLYEGEYRTAVLQACYKTRQILTERQIAKFETLP